MDLTKANCEGEDTNIFFPDDSGYHAPADIKFAKDLCKGCEIRFDCLQYALDEKIIDGIWGGLSANERKNLKRKSASVRFNDLEIERREEIAPVRTKVRSAASSLSNIDPHNQKVLKKASDKYVAGLQKALSAFGDTLNEHTRELALAKINNPDLSLSEIGARMNPPISKDVVAGRLRRLMQRVEESSEEN